MPAIPILSQSDPDKSVDRTTASCINMYLQENPISARYPESAYYTPGLTVFTSSLAGNARALFEEHGVTYCIAGNTFYSLASNGTATSLGTLNTSSGFAKIVGIHSQFLIIDGTNGYVFIPSLAASTTLSQTAASSATTLHLSSMDGVLPGATIVITQDSGTKTTTISTVNFAANTVVIASGLSGQATSGNAVTISGTNIFAQIQDTGFPQTAVDIVAQDEFGIALGSGTQNWFASAISDLTSWPVLSFASVTGNQNNLVACQSLTRFIWLLSTYTTEIWYNAGNVNFTFARRSDVYIEYGCAARSSLAYGNNTLFFLGQSRTGGSVVLMMNGFSPQVISTDSLNYQISTYTTISDAIGFCYQQEGQEFYILTFPTQGITWAYNITDGKWHQRASLISSVQTRWIPQCYTYCYGKQLVGDYQSSTIYSLDMTNYQENGVSITRTIITPPFFNSNLWTYIDRVQIDFDNTPGIGLNAINLYVSRDGGRTYGSAKAATPVQDANGMWRVYWNRLGYGKDLVLKIQTTMNNKFIILGATANIRSGTT
jgi:hypothetical protein